MGKTTKEEKFDYVKNCIEHLPYVEKALETINEMLELDRVHSIFDKKALTQLLESKVEFTLTAGVYKIHIEKEEEKTNKG